MPFFLKANGAGGRGAAAARNVLSSSLTSNMLAPRQLFQQILVMQGIYYFIGFILILFTCIVSGDPFTLKMVFSWEPVRIDTTMGWTLVLLWLLDTFFSVLALTVVVGRSKLALDFTLTLHGIHLLVCWCVAGKFPASKLWWGLQAVSILLMLMLGTWTTQWRELRATFFEPIPQSEEIAVNSNTAMPGVAAVPQHHYDEFELQPTVSPLPVATSSAHTKELQPVTQTSGSAVNKNNDNYEQGFESEDEGDITAGSKLLRDAGRI